MTTPRRRLFFDIETSFYIGWFWNTGPKQYIGYDQVIEPGKIICVSYKWENEDQIHHLDWGEDQDDKQLLIDFIKILNAADEIIAHNGDRFDIKWLRTRCLFHRIEMFPAYQTIDTIKIAKSQFNFPSNRLDNIAKYLGLERKLSTGGAKLWKAVQLHKDPEALKKMLAYCDQDVLVLEEVYQVMKNYAKHKMHYGVLHGGEKYECPECGSPNQVLNKSYTTAMGTPKYHVRCKDCGKSHTISAKSYLDLLTYKTKNGKM